MPTGTEIYEENAYKTTEKHLEDIKHTATTLGVSPQAIFGAMAEEVHDYEITTGLDIIAGLNGDLPRENRTLMLAVA